MINADNYERKFIPVSDSKVPLYLRPLRCELGCVLTLTFYFLISLRFLKERKAENRDEERFLEEVNRHRIG